MEKKVINVLLLKASLSLCFRQVLSSFLELPKV